MAFNTLRFWLVFPVVFLIYWGGTSLFSRRKTEFQNLFLVIASYVLYMCTRPAAALFLFGVTLVTYFGAVVVEKRPGKRTFMAVFLILSLLPLLLFKYWNFFVSPFKLPGLNWAVPLGISFFTLQAVGYLCDVNSGKIAAERSFLDYSLFVCFFPQLVSGPISKAADLLPQLKEARAFRYDKAVDGLKWLVWGMFLKLFIADRVGIYVDTVFDYPDGFNGATMAVVILLFSIQIYCDFAGYSFMAMGVAKVLGVDLVYNFRRPYFSVSVTEFWHRWHISLSRWLKDYIYIPLGGNRCSRIRNYFNIIVTFLVSGLWHGANITFIVWGLIHGVVQVVEKAVGLARKNSTGILKYVRILITFILVVFAWVFFRSPSLPAAFKVIGKIFTEQGAPDIAVMGYINLLLYVVGIGILLFRDIRDELGPGHWRLCDTKGFKWVFYVGIFCLTLAAGALDSGQFIYANF